MLKKKPVVAKDIETTGNDGQIRKTIEQISLLELDLGRADLNAIVDKLNQVIKRINDNA